MKQIIQYIYLYFRQINTTVFLSSTLFMAMLVLINYSAGLDEWMSNMPYPLRLLLYYSIYLVAFFVPYAFYYMKGGLTDLKNKMFVIMMVFAPLLFAFKHTFPLPLTAADSSWNAYWRHIVYWPLIAVLITTLLYIIWKSSENAGRTFYGLSPGQLDLKPYFLMLALMIPLVAAASTQPDFLAMYPKVKIVDPQYGEWYHKLLFEVSYGTDFITIELFFRGFLVLAFVKWAGKEAILPMACFYCTIHFGKPIGECVSSYFGGLLLGIVSFHTRSIVGGLIVHLGIAWMMELGGYLGNLVNK